MLENEKILQETIAILSEMTADWDTGFSGGIGPQTGIIADLAFESIDVVQLVGAIEERFGKRGLPFEEILIKDGNYVDEIKVSEIADFLAKHLK